MADVVIMPTGLGDRGQQYRVTYLGSVLVESSRNPEFDACRALQVRGITGKLAVWRQGAAAPCMTLDIERGAGLTISDTDKGGPRLAPWRPFMAVDAQNGLSSCAGSPRTAADARAAAAPHGQTIGA